ncbi:MlaD family protein [Acuticoccus sediminis]|uniref:MlaD family protein n=1 Tax=Acuticoccus sediminis TaxID=2184697 RepID=UPI001CFEE18E|nr:MlaD family protein [Acuticoccus sediminis]
METRANYVAIGIFVLVVLAGAFGSLWWLYRSSGSGATEALRIIFPEAVTGLSTGAGVYFNGIRIGEVTSLEFPPEGGDNVIAITRVNPSAPIKVNTQAQLASQGLTGVAYVSLVGGTGESIFEAAEKEDKVPTLQAATSAFTNVLDTLQSVLGRLDSTLGSVRQLVDENQGNLSGVVQNVRTITDNLAQASPQIPAMVTDFSNAASAIGEAAPKIAGVVENANGILAAIDPSRVTTIVGNVESFTGELPQLGQKAGTVIDNVGGIITRLSDTANTLNDAVAAADQVVRTIDAGTITKILTNVATSSTAFADRSDAIGNLIDNASRISTDVASITDVIAQRKDSLDQAITDASSLIADARGAVQAAAPVIENLSKAAAAVTPEKVTGIVDNVQTVTSTLAGQSENVASLVASATDAAKGIDSVTAILSARSESIGTTLDQAAQMVTNLREASEGAPKLVTSAETLLSDAAATVRAVDATRINAVVSNVESFTQTIAGKNEAISQFIDSANGTAQRAEAISSAVAQRMPAIGTAIDNATAAIASVRETTDKLPQMADALQPGIQNVADALSAIDPAAIDAIVANVEDLTATLAGQGPAVERIVNRVEGVVADANSVAADARVIIEQVAARRTEIGTAIDNATAAIASARQAADAAPQLVASLQPGIENFSAALSAVDPTAVEGIVGSVRTLADTISNRTGSIDHIITSAESTLGNAETISTSVAARMPAIEGAIDNAAATVADARVFAQSLPEFATTLQPGIENVSAVLSAIDPTAVQGIVSDVKSMTETLVGQTENVRSIIANVDGTAADARQIAATVSAQMPQVTGAIDDARAAVASARTFADTLPGYAETLQPGVENVSAVLQAVDPQAISDIVASAKTLTDTLGASAPQVQHFIATAGVAADDVAEITGRVRGQLGTISEAIDTANSAVADVKTFTATLPALRRQLDPVVDAVTEVVTAVDPVMVRAIMTNVRDVTLTLSDQRENVSQIVSTVGDASRRIDQVAAAVSARADEISSAIDSVSTFAGALRDQAPSIDGIVQSVSRAANGVADTVASINTSAINGILDNAQKVATAVGSRTDAIGKAIDDVVQSAEQITRSLDGADGENGLVQEVLDRVKRISVNVENASNKLGTLVDRANAVLGGEVQRVFDGVNEATASIEQVAAAFAPRAGQIANGLSRFSQSGLDDLRALINQGRSTLRSIESAVSSFDRDPSRIIFGGDNAPRYSPQRR